MSVCSLIWGDPLERLLWSATTYIFVTQELLKPRLSCLKSNRNIHAWNGIRSYGFGYRIPAHFKKENKTIRKKNPKRLTQISVHEQINPLIGGDNKILDIL